MNSIREIYKVGKGPSSSHTMGPEKASLIYKDRYPQALSYRVTLFGSLAATGKGHLTDVAIESILGKDTCLIIWEPTKELEKHPNGIWFEVEESKGLFTNKWEVYSVGGGSLYSIDLKRTERKVYSETTFKEIHHLISNQGIPLWQYIEDYEGKDIWEFLEYIWETMKRSIERGILAEGTLHGGLHLARKAASFYKKAMVMGDFLKKDGLLTAYALAVSEENAAGNTIVTAPTCGSCGVVPATIRFVSESVHCQNITTLHALATAALFGNLIKTNASISGAEVGCQGEVGSASAMAAAAAAQLYGGSTGQIEYAAEMGLEHHLGLTCDPVKGLVQIPCIERNAHGAMRAVNSANYALYSDGKHHVSFDDIVIVMKETGKALPQMYRETSEGGIAKIYQKSLDLTE